MAPKVILLDLDGTLTNTADPAFKTRKDGKEATCPDDIPILDGAAEFVAQLKRDGFSPAIVSDSHPRYVEPIAKQFFDIPSLSLADKPNISKAQLFIESTFPSFELSNSMVIGDTWLDVEMARGLGIPSVLVNLYNAVAIEERDGIGQMWKHLKSGPTFVASSFSEIRQIIDSPEDHLSAAEGSIIGHVAKRAFKIYERKDASGYVAFRSIGRQAVGDCDSFEIAACYAEFQRKNRSRDLIDALSRAITRYLASVKEAAPGIEWHILTHIPDKKTTQPPNKMGELASAIQCGIAKANIFAWASEMDGTIRSCPTYGDRRKFVKDFLGMKDDANVRGKNIVILDDQITTAATAHHSSALLRGAGARSILFISPFFMTSSVTARKICSKCGKRMQLKIRKLDGNRFYSCTPPAFRGNGCGHIENYHE